MGFTNIDDAQIRGLTAAGATSAERATYEALTRIHGTDPDNPGWCFRSVAECAEITGYHRDTCRDALRALCRMEFRPGVTVLERVGGGHRGRVTTYDDLLWLHEVYWKGGSQSPSNDGNKGGSLSPSNLSTKGGENERKGGQNGNKGGSLSPSQNRYTEQIHRTTPLTPLEGGGPSRRERREARERAERRLAFLAEGAGRVPSGGEARAVVADMGPERADFADFCDAMDAIGAQGHTSEYDLEGTEAAAYRTVGAHQTHGLTWRALWLALRTEGGDER